MRVDNFEIKISSNDIKWIAIEKIVYDARTLLDILKEITKKGAASAIIYNWILIKYRFSIIDLFFENSTLYDLFSIFISSVMLN